MKKVTRDKITEQIDYLTSLCNDKTGSLFIHADLEDAISHIHLKGDIRILAMAFGNKMENNEEFKKIILSIISSFLVNNPEDKEEFIKTLILVENPINLN